jgi:hypothetical protein
MGSQGCRDRESPSARPANAYNGSRRGHAHGIPSTPFSIDAERGTPVKLGMLRDRPLHSLVSLGEDVEPTSVQVFTQKDLLVSAMDALLSADQRRQATAAAPVRLGLTIDLAIWQDINLSGCAWEFDSNTDISVLTNFDQAWACGFLWWGWQQLSTKGSSFMVAINWPFFGFRDRLGNSIAFVLNPPSGNFTLSSGFVNSLVPFGWNDRAISITLPGATFP